MIYENETNKMINCDAVLTCKAAILDCKLRLEIQFEFYFPLQGVFLCVLCDLVLPVHSRALRGH